MVKEMSVVVRSIFTNGIIRINVHTTIKFSGSRRGEHSMFVLIFNLHL